jgi:hypothetical protein
MELTDPSTFVQHPSERMTSAIVTEARTRPCPNCGARTGQPCTMVVACEVTPMSLVHPERQARTATEATARIRATVRCWCGRAVSRNGVECAEHD